MHSLCLLVVLTTLLASVHSHSWIEQLTVIAPNGTFIGAPGFPRGNILRSSPGFSDTGVVNLLPPNGRPGGNKILPTDGMCRASQAKPNQTPGSPALQAAPGSLVALRYQENGHVTIPQNPPNKPPNSGKVFVYGTTSPKDDETFLSIHNVWNADGSGGDRRGKLLATQTYDDGQCYQVNGGPVSQQRQKQFPHQKSQEMGGDLWCQTDIKLPDDAPKGKSYTLYWVWDWSTVGGAGQEIYTTCMDISVISAAPAPGNVNFAQQDLGRAAVKAVFEKMGASSPVSGPAGGSNPPAAAAPSQPQPQQSQQSQPQPQQSQQPQPQQSQQPQPQPPQSQQPQSQQPQTQPPRPSQTLPKSGPGPVAPNTPTPTPSIKTVYVTLVPSTMTGIPTDMVPGNQKRGGPTTTSTATATSLAIRGARHARYGA